MVFMTPLSRPGFSGKRSVSGDLKAPQNLEEIYRGMSVWSLTINNHPTNISLWYISSTIPRCLSSEYIIVHDGHDHRRHRHHYHLVSPLPMFIHHRHHPPCLSIHSSAASIKYLLNESKVDVKPCLPQVEAWSLTSAARIHGTHRTCEAAFECAKI